MAEAPWRKTLVLDANRLRNERVGYAAQPFTVQEGAGLRAKAKRLLNKPLAIEKRSRRVDNQGHFYRLSNLTVLGQWDGRYDETAGLFFHAFQRRIGGLGPKHQDVRLIPENLANHLRGLSI